ncbi:3-ketoacyl-CoA thiolase [Piscirickettsia salmonis]|uniref:acetyl-CoA C-acyltransferase n=1 Tax=Piscirickettsia salmonis TaxID=1238 RepID=A0A1L6TCB3_PISSA|nr:acetyl-CoA C-acyltransferase [Piscirickettsia salmonis]AKP74133.1 acetyl-CoA acetyltransferase [Piscirickettsia salmonis LF-89 = ATCC VR-1361]ALB23006.1 acetyl-CoA C-acetyltransferase family protein [Piscirickettsia salmonis]ALY02950.1 acetyl-CoA acetyltransferase [Piscirickettsia salmonis]AMA42506.1 acetyl-CoA acetyltransferase [Piscirickettsia salmonis]AOS34976.1 acetyl-CoA acetyltransferase [Piscirickettsia salmonis]
MKKVKEVYIVAANRTAVTKAYKGIFAHTRPDDLLAHVIANTLAKVPTVDPANIDDVIIGCAMPEAEQGMNVARMGSLLAGLPNSVPAMTVNRFCCSGVETAALAAARIGSGTADIILSGGVESMSMVPLGGNKPNANPKLFDGDHDVAIAYGMGLTAERVADKYQISRERQDEFALTSHRRAVMAIEHGYFNDEILPMDIVRTWPDLKDNQVIKKSILVNQDEGPRPDSNLAALAQLKAVFMQGGSVTAGNSSQMSDGAGATLLVSEKALHEHSLTPLGRFIGYAVAGVEPEYMGIGPVAAIPKVLKQTSLSLNDIEWMELNEAFAAQSLAVANQLDLNAEIVNPQGGAIALGHPLGATGAIRIATLLHGMRREKKKYGMVTMCIGIGMGAAAVIEAL